MGAGSRERYPPAHGKVPLPAPCSLPRAANPGADRAPDLHAEHVLPRLALQPQQAGVEVPGHRATREIAPQPAVQPLSDRSEEHTSELQSRQYLVCRLLLEKKKTN